MVVGGGIVGLCTAFALQQQGCHVSVIDTDHRAINASTASAGIIGGSAVVPWASAGLWSKIPAMCMNPNSPLTLSFPVPANIVSFFIHSHRAGSAHRYQASAEGLATLGLSGYDNWMLLLEGIDEARALFRQTGCYFVYRTPADRVNDEKNNTLRQQFGMQLESLDSTQTAVALPALSPADGGSVKVLKAGHVTDPFALQLLLRSAIQDNGGRLISSAVTKFGTSGSRVNKVHTTQGEHDIDGIVIAAGSGSSVLAKQLGSSIPMISGNGYSLELNGASIRLDAPLLFLKHGIAVTPTSNGIRVAGLVSIGGARKRHCDRHYRRLLNFALSTFARLTYKTVVHHTGARPLTADSLPVIGCSPYFQNAWFNFGHGHWGLTQAASSAKTLVKLFAQNAQIKEENPFSATRF